MVSIPISIMGISQALPRLRVSEVVARTLHCIQNYAIRLYSLCLLKQIS